MGDPLRARPKKLLIVTTVAATLRAFLFPFADHFRGLGWKVDAMASGASLCSECAAHFDRVHDVNWSRNPFAPRNLLRLAALLRRLRAIIAEGRYDIVHVHTPVAAFITRLALSPPLDGFRPTVVYTAHGFHFQPGNAWLPNLIYRALERLAARRTDYLITINQTDEIAARRLALAPPGRLFPMPGIGVDPLQFHPAAVPPSEVLSLRIRLGIPATDVVFVMIAEFISRKRHQDAVLAFAKLQAPNCHLIFVGDGPCRGEIERERQARVHFAGHQEDVRPYILAARAVLLTSHQEGLPRSLMESLSCGVPVIGSDIRGIRDLVQQTGGGMLFPAGDIAGLASCFTWFLEHPAEAARMGERARNHAGIYSFNNILRLHEDLYRQV